MFLGVIGSSGSPPSIPVPILIMTSTGLSNRSPRRALVNSSQISCDTERALPVRLLRRFPTTVIPPPHLREMTIPPLSNPSLAPLFPCLLAERIRHRSRDSIPPRSQAFAPFLLARRNLAGRVFWNTEALPVLGLLRQSPGHSLRSPPAPNRHLQPHLQRMIRRPEAVPPGGVYFRSFGESRAILPLLPTQPRLLGNPRE